MLDLIALVGSVITWIAGIVAAFKMGGWKMGLPAWVLLSWLFWRPLLMTVVLTVIFLFFGVTGQNMTA